MITFVKFLLFSIFVVFFLSFSSPLQISSPPRPAAAREAGDDFYRDGAYAEAFRIYRSIHAADAACLTDTFFRMKAGISAYHAGECSLAVFYLDTAAVTDADLLIYCLYFRARSFFQLKEYNNALRVLERISCGDLSYAIERDAARLRVETLRMLKRYNDANTLLRRLIAENRSSADRAGYYLTMAKNYHALNDRENVYLTAKKLADSYPRNYAAAEAMTLYIRIKRERGEKMSFAVLDWALDMLLTHRRGRAALELLKNNPVGALREAEKLTLLYQEGRAHYYAPDYPEAKNIFLGLNSQATAEKYRSSAVLFLARISARTGDDNKAVYYYKDYIRRFPSSSMTGEIRWKLGWMAEGRKEYGEALEQYGAVAKSGSVYTERSLMRMGFCRYEMREYRKAAEIFDRLARRGREESMSEGGLYWKGVCLLLSGDSAGAALEFRKVIDRYPLHYYAFRARRRLGIPVEKPAGTALRFDSLLTGGVRLPDDPLLRESLKIGEVAGRRYGGDAVLHFLRTPQGRKYDPVTGWNAYNRIGAYNEALKIGIRLRQKIKAEGGDETDPEVLWRVYPPFFYTLVRKHAFENRISAGLVYALMRRESAFEVDVVSSAGAIGLMQMLPSMGRSVGEQLGEVGVTREHLTQAAWNIRLGTKHLSDLIKSFDGVVPAAVASYNAGEGAARRWIKMFGADDIETFIEAIEYTETRNYVRRVLSDFWIYENLYGL